MQFETPKKEIITLHLQSQAKDKVVEHLATFV